MSKNILITGANGGFGSLMTEELLKSGYKVAATMRDIDSRNKEKAQSLKTQGAVIVPMDVTLDNSVAEGVSMALKELGGIDVVINNAGRGIIAYQEACSSQDWMKIFDINVFGVHRVIQRVIPHFREQQDGLFINISSILGRMCIPYYGPYNASKWAVEALSENYKFELSQFGIDVTIVEPGGFPTTFMKALLSGTNKNDCDKFYSEIQPQPQAFLAGFEEALKNNPAQDPRNVALACKQLIDTPKGSRPFRTIVDKMGMGQPIEKYNENLQELTSQIFNNFGLGHLLKVKK